jgi:molybdopterin synthase sulfur carrier subunit
MARVLMFGRLADLAGWRVRVVTAGSIAALTEALCAEDALLAEGLRTPGVQVAVDQQLIRGDCAIDEGSEVAYLPPMSGG